MKGYIAWLDAGQVYLLEYETLGTAELALPMIRTCRNPSARGSVYAFGCTSEGVARRKAHEHFGLKNVRAKRARLAPKVPTPKPNDSIAKKAREAGLPPRLVRARINTYGWSLEKALTTPNPGRGKYERVKTKAGKRPGISREKVRFE